MRELATAARAALAAGEHPVAARVVASTGFGGRRAGEAALYCGGTRRAGALLGAAADEAVRGAEVEGRPAVLLELTVTDTEAVERGLACGGSATVLASDLAELPIALWEALEAGWPVALVTRPGHGGALAVVDHAGTPAPVCHGSLGTTEEDHAALAAAHDVLRAGREGATVYPGESGGVVVEVFVPATTVVVVGEGDLARALGAQASMLGWSVSIEPAFTARAEARLRALRRTDGVVVCSHDPAVDTPALAAALRTGCYVGALGSRHTQAARRDRLRALGFDDGVIALVHGPVGLDLGARTPEETAVAIVAELLAHRSGRSAAPLRLGSGPING